MSNVKFTLSIDLGSNTHIEHSVIYEHSSHAPNTDEVALLEKFIVELSKIAMNSASNQIHRASYEVKSQTKPLIVQHKTFLDAYAERDNLMLSSMFSDENEGYQEKWEVRKKNPNTF